jgi:multidrug efflux pump subunit AcrA (membrane-fusion protein)
MKNSPLPWKRIRIACAVGLIAAGALTWSMWWPPLRGWVGGAAGRTSAEASHDDHASHAGHEDHAGHAGHSDETSIALSPQAMRNLGLTGESLRPVELSDYRRPITVPAVIVEKPGRTRLQVATPMTGIVTHVHTVQGEAVRPGELLFELRLTHEDLVIAQTDFLKLLGELDVERKELQRLKGITAGAIAGKLLLEREYAIDKLEAQLEAQREALRLHGLSDEQVQRIEGNRELLRTLQVYAPSPDEHSESEFRLTEDPAYAVSLVDDAPAKSEEAPASLVLEDLRVHKGQAVTAGETLCVLADHSSLFIEGQAFEVDAPAVLNARQQGWRVTAVFDSPTGEIRVPDLPIVYVSSEVHAESRTLHFYVDLPNERLDTPSGQKESRYLTWRHRPGQRLQLRVPIEQWEDEMVLPVSAVAREGAESFVFVQNGDHFDRIPVHVKFRDQSNVVVAQDGALFPGDIVARRGAHQLQMALKNKSGGAIDPHAGHTH